MPLLRMAQAAGVKGSGLQLQNRSVLGSETHLPPGHGHALRQQLLDAPRGVELRQAGVRLGDQPSAEGAQPQLPHRPVVQDLRADVHLLHVVLQAGAQPMFSTVCLGHSKR